MTKEEKRAIVEELRKDLVDMIKEDLIEMGFMRYAGADGNNKKAGMTVAELKKQTKAGK